MLSYLPFGKKKAADEAKQETETKQAEQPATPTPTAAAADVAPSTNPAAEATPAPSTESPTAAQPIPIFQAPEQKYEGEEAMSPVLSHYDEEFLRQRLEESVEEPPVVILEGSSGTTTPKAELAATPDEKPAEEVELKTGDATEDKKKTATSDWKEELQTRWTGLKRTVSSAAERRRAKSKSKSPGPSKKEKSKEKETVVEEPEKEEKKLDKGKEKATDPEKQEEDKEADELTAALDRLNLAAENGRAFSLSQETKAMLDRFTQILKDLVNGVPTAYDDLVTFLEGSSKQLEEIFTSLPNFLQKLIQTLPNKLPKNLSPELLRTFAAAAPAASVQAEKLATPSLKDLVTKPGMILGLLKSVVNVLKTRFPALMGANMALSMGLFVLLFVLWYCYKRGREERLTKEMEEVERKVQEIEKQRAEEEARGGVQEEAQKIPAGGAGTVEEPLVMVGKDKIL